MPSATFGLFVNSSTVEAKNLTVGVESYESTVTSGVFALVGDLSAETLTINVKAAEEVDPDVESIGNASPAFDYSEGTYGLYAQDSTVETGNMNIVLDATNSPSAKGISSSGGSLATNNLSIRENAQNVSGDDYQAVGLEATEAKVSVTEAMNVMVESRNSKYAKGVSLKDGELTAGDVSITVKGQADPGSNYKADGFLADESTVTTGSLNISVTNTDKASGIVLGDKVTMTVNDLTILAKSDDRVGGAWTHMQKPLKRARLSLQAGPTSGLRVSWLVVWPSSTPGLSSTAKPALRLPVSSRPLAFGPEPAHLWTSMIMP